MKPNLPKQIKLRIVLLIIIFLPLLCLSQNEPSWMNQLSRTEQYPSNVYITGFAHDAVNQNESVAKTTERVKDLARADLSKSIISSVQSISKNYQQSNIVNGSETFTENFESTTLSSTNIKINGTKVETFVSKNNIVSAFAYANKYEVIGYYKANLNMYITQIEGFIASANELEAINEKIKAKNEFNKPIPLFNQVKEAQGILSALDNKISDEDLKMTHTMQLYNSIIQANARLSQGVFVFIETTETIFGEKISAIENNLKSILAVNSCTFISDAEKADWRIVINAEAREFNLSNGVYFSYVDATVQLFKASTNKIVYQNEFSQKGSHGQSYNMAAKNAYSKISTPISEKLLTWINN